MGWQDAIRSARQARGEALMAGPLEQKITINGHPCSLFVFAKAGDEIPLHSHPFTHGSIACYGEIEIFDDSGTLAKLSPQSEQFGVEFSLGRRHGIRALTAGTVVVNINPKVD